MPEPRGTSLDELERLAREATAGPWYRLYDDYGESEPPDMRPGTYFLTDAPHGDQHPIAQAVAGPDAAYIAAANPEVILDLIHQAKRGARIETAAREALANIEEAYLGDRRDRVVRLTSGLDGAARRIHAIERTPMDPNDHGFGASDLVTRRKVLAALTAKGEPE